MSDIYDPNEPSDWWQRADAAKQVERETETLNDQIDRLTRERDELREALIDLRPAIELQFVHVEATGLACEGINEADWELCGHGVCHSVGCIHAKLQRMDIALANLNKTDPET